MPAIRAAGRTVPRVAWSAAAWCCVFAAAHVFWALGGSAGLASSAGSDLAARRPVVFVALGLWGVACALLLAALVVVAVGAAPPGSRAARIGAWTVGVVGVGLLVRGALLEVLLVADAAGIRTAVGPQEARWSLVLWNPWFVLGGALFVGTARRRLRATRRRWSTGRPR